MAEASGTPVDDALAQLERQRRDRWVVAATLVVALVVALALVAVGGDTGMVAAAAAAAFLAVTVGFGISVALQERRAARLVRALMAEREHATSLDARLAALDAVHRAARAVFVAEDLPQTFDRILAAVADVADAGSCAVLLRVEDRLTVAAATGPDAPTRGHTLPLDTGHAGAAVRRNEPVVAGRGAPWGSWTAGSVVAVPLRLGDRAVGALVAARGGDAPAFLPADVAAVSLFGEHAALALRNAWRIEELEDAVERLQREAGEQAEAVAGLVHDLRSPLTSIAGYVDLLLDREDRMTRQRRRAVLGDVRIDVARLRERVDGLLQVASAGAIDLSDAVVVDLSVLAHEAAREARGTALAQGASRQIAVTTRRPVAVRGNAVALRRAVTNLLDNAVEHTPPGSPVEVTTSLEGDTARLVVRDHGPGLDLAVAKQIVLGSPGVGDADPSWGLRVVAALIRAHGGRLRLEPAEGGGTSSTIELPAVRQLG